MPTPTDVIQRIPVAQDIDGTGKYIISSAKCSKCNRLSTCISEPPGSAYECRECYTGLTNKQISQRFNDLWKIVDDKTFIPDWATWMYLDSQGKRDFSDEDIYQ